MELVDAALQIPPHVLELFLELRSAVGRRPREGGWLARALPWTRCRLEGDEQQRAREVPVVDAPHGQLQREPGSVRLDARGPLDDRGIGLHDLAKRGSERRAQAFARHLDDAQVGAAGRELEIGADAPVDLLDLTPPVDDDGRRSEALGERAAQRLRQIEPGPLGERPGGAGSGAGDRPMRPAKRRPERAESLRRKSFQRLSSAEKSSSEPATLSDAPSRSRPPGFRL